MTNTSSKFIGEGLTYDDVLLVPAYSEEENIPNLLNEINKAFSEDTDFEVIIVDDGSPVSLKEVLKIDNHSFNISIISNQYNLGQSKSIEIGLKNSTGHVIGLIDADCQNPPEELKKLYDFYNSNNFDAVISDVPIYMSPNPDVIDPTFNVPTLVMCDWSSIALNSFPFLKLKTI